MTKSGSLKRLLTAILKVMFSLFDVFIHGLFKLVYGKHGQKMPPIKNVLLLDSASSLAYKIRHKKVTSLDVVNSFVDRIKEINPLLNCVVDDRFDEARKEARAVDDLIKSNAIPAETLAKEKPFLGVPFTTKDCIAVKGLLHTGGVYRRKNIRADEDADVVASLRTAGAIPLALTNVSELCMWWDSANPVHGRTSNPYDTNRIVGGSSGGEGCIQGAAGSAFGIGSDIGGSIRIPATFNGIFGHKPSNHVVPIRGQYPAPTNAEQESFLGIGPMCRRAEDLLPVLKVIAQKNALDLQLDKEVNLGEIKFYYQDTDMGGKFVTPVKPEIRQLFKKIALHFDKAHKIKVQKVQIKRFAKSIPMWLACMASDTGPTFGEQLVNLEGKICEPWELLKWCFRLSNHTFIGIFTAIIERFGVKPGHPKHTHLVEERDNLKRELIDLLGDDGVLIYPTHPTPAPYHNEPLFKAFNFGYTAVINLLGLPATHCPMGLNENGLPIGVQVIANHKMDRLCLAVAREMEKAFGGWVPPEIQA